MIAARKNKRNKEDVEMSFNKAASETGKKRVRLSYSSTSSANNSDEEKTTKRTAGKSLSENDHASAR